MNDTVFIGVLLLTTVGYFSALWQIYHAGHRRGWSDAMDQVLRDKAEHKESHHA